MTDPGVANRRVRQCVRVTAVSGIRLTVEPEATSGCAACAAGMGCGNAWFGRLFRAASAIQIEGQARIGDRLVLTYPDGLLQRRAILLYGTFLLSMVLGAMLGHLFSIQAAWTDAMGDLSSLSGSIVSMALAVRYLRSRFARETLPVVTIDHCEGTPRRGLGVDMG